MRDRRDYSVYPSNIDLLEAFKKLEDFLSKSKFGEEIGLCPNAKHQMKLSKNRTLSATDFAEFIVILEEYPNSFPIEVHAHFKNSDDERITTIINIDFSDALIIVEASNKHFVSSFHEKIKEIFHLSNPFEEVEKSISKYNLKKSIFLAHKFDNIGNMNSSTMKKFLTYLGFQVKEGSGYEGRNIPNKVLDKIESQDIFVCLVTSGDHSWILSEASTAKALNKYIILICQEGVEFNKGILGNDFEYLTFPQGFIERIFIDLLYTLPS